MSNARDELAAIAYGAMFPASREEPATWPPSLFEVADAILAAGYRKVEPAWAETLVNDGAYEYTISSDCDGSNVQYWRRIPGMTYEGQASPWERYEPEAS